MIQGQAGNTGSLLQRSMAGNTGSLLQCGMAGNTGSLLQRSMRSGAASGATLSKRKVLLVHRGNRPSKNLDGAILSHQATSM
jgi:hypothetical protein